MRRAGSLFEIDQEPLFEPGSLETDGTRDEGWDDGHDNLPPASATAPRHETDETRARLGGGDRRSRVLVVVAAVGVVGFLGSRLTQVAGAPTVAPRGVGTTPLPPAAVTPAAHSIPVRQRHAAAPRRARVSRSRPNARTVARARQAGPLVSAAPAVPAPAPRAAAPPAPEPQGFTGEFF